MALKKAWLIALSGILLISGSTLLWRQLAPSLTSENKDAEAIATVLSPIQPHDAGIASAFTAEKISKITFQQDGQDRFDLLLVNYQDRDHIPRNALLFAKTKQESVMLPSATGLRQSIWHDAAEAIKQKATEDALFLSWWDDAQRLHFLSGRNTWLDKPGPVTFTNTFWRTLQTELTPASSQKIERLTNMARWLTMDSEQALQEIRKTFGSEQPLYLLVNNDLLMRLSEMANYGGSPLALISKIVPVSSNPHGDIGTIKQLAQEEGDGNYLLQKEGTVYRVWLTPKQSTAEKNSLLVRLLPFVESLKQLPDGVEMVYQSHWGGFLSIYRLNPVNK